MYLLKIYPIQQYGIPQKAINEIVVLFSISLAGGDTLVHLHWLVIVGGLSFMASVLQLVPVDNSAGSKLTTATVGRDIQLLVSGVLTLFKFVLFSLIVFNVGGVATSLAFSKQRLIFDYLWISQLLSSEKVCVHLIMDLLLYVTVIR